MFEGPVCELSRDERVTFWVRASPGARLTVHVDAVERKTEWRPVDTGLQTTIELPARTRSVSIRADAHVDGHTASDVFRLAVRSWAKPALLREAERLLARSPTTAEALLDGLDVSTNRRLRAEAVSIRGRSAYIRGRFDDVVRHRRHGADLAATTGMIEKQAGDLATIAFVAIWVRPDAERARKVVDELGTLASMSAQAGVAHAYNEAMLASLTGDLRAAERWFEETETRAVRVDLLAYSTGAAAQRAILLARRGHFDAAFEVYRRVQPRPGPCHAARALANQAWIGLMAWEVGVDAPFDPEHLARQALERLQACVEKHSIPNLLSMLALSRIHHGDADGALHHVAAARQHGASLRADVQWWLADVEARAARIRQRYARARRAYRQLNEVAKQRGLKSAQWRAQVGLAGVEEAAGRVRTARRAYAEAERQLDASGLRALFLSPLSVSSHLQQAAARRYASLLLRLNQPHAAVQVLQRQARRRVLGVSRAARVAALPAAQRQRWNGAVLRYVRLRTIGDQLDGRQWGEAPETSVETARQLRGNRAAIREALDLALSHLGTEAQMPQGLPKMPADEVLLGYDRVADGWLGFAWGRGTLRTVRLAPGASNRPLEGLSRWLLAPFRRELQAYSRVRIAARSGLEQVDFHALPFDGVPLIQTHTVTYTFDAPRDVRPVRKAHRALVVADPDGNLPGARDEARLVVRRLRQLDLDTFFLVGSEVERARILGRMDVGLLHWAGHARQLEGRSDALAASVLPLAAGAYLTAGDVLALPRVPDRVVLSGCETSPTDTTHLGVAQAFVLAGASAVIATSRAVRDDEARAIGAALYASGQDDLGPALRSAQLALRAEPIDWAAFRTIVP